MLDVAQIGHRLLVLMSRGILERRLEVSAGDRLAVDDGKHFRGHRCGRRDEGEHASPPSKRTEGGTTAPPSVHEREDGYGVTQPRGQPASAFEYSGCTHAPPGC